MTTKPKHRLDGSLRQHPSRDRRDWPNRESTNTTQRKYREYHSLENQVARTRAAEDLKLMKKVAREPRRQSLTELRLGYYEEFKNKRKMGAK